MKRLLMAGVTASLLGIASNSSTAQDRPGPRYEGRLSRFREEKSRAASAEFLIYQRAQVRAQQRAARLEAYRWMGIAPTRPSIPYSVYAVNLNPGLYTAWGGWSAWNWRW